VRDKAAGLATTTSDLIHQQVLDNLAHAVVNPTAMPYLDLPGQGTAQIQATAQATYTPGWDFISSAGVYLGRYLFDKQTAAVQGQYACQETWQIVPNNNPDRMYLMQCAYRRATGTEDPESATILNKYYELKNRLAHSKVSSPMMPPANGPAIPPLPPDNTTPAAGPAGAAWNEPVRASFAAPTAGDKKPEKPDGGGGVQALPLGIPYEQFVKPGWYCVGRKKDVPKKGVCYVGRHCDTYVWVTPDHLDDLTEFTLAILDIATPFTIDAATGEAVRSPNPYGLLPVPPPAPIH
jgi:hypothetical protein